MQMSHAQCVASWLWVTEIMGGILTHVSTADHANNLECSLLVPKECMYLLIIPPSAVRVHQRLCVAVHVLPLLDLTV